MKERCKKIWEIFKKIQLNSLVLFCSILYLELIFIIFISNTVNLQLFINILITTIVVSKLFNLLIGFFNEKIQVILTSITLFFLGLIYSLQGIFYKIFKVYFSIYNIALKDQIKSFVGNTIKYILNNSIYLLLFMVPFIVFLIIRKRIKVLFVKNSKKTIIILLITILIWIGIGEVYVISTKNKRYSNYDIYHNVNNISLIIKRFGVINSYKLEIKRIVFGFKPKTLEVISINDNKNNSNYEENKLNINLDDTGNYNVDLISEYMREEEATYKNKYTGMFKGYNLIYITAEGFSEIAVDKDLTPTLYKLVNNGFVFNNFYTPNNLSTIGGEFQSLTGLYPDYAELSKWRDGTNYFPYGLGYAFRNLGYSTYAYHNNSYVFQDRNKYIASQGFTNFLACYNGLEKRMNCEVWPQSDDEMIEVTVNDYINSDTPFLAYYMTVSGHMDYTFDDNYISYKNKDLVSGLDKGEEAKAYVATQIELDKALERLISELEKHGKLDNTVIVLMADHYPYGLDNDSINSLSSYYRDDIEINHNALILWNNKMDKVIVDKACMAVDVIPTVYNLFGVDYDSRLFSGKDILSTSSGIAILSDRSWITDKGVYYAPTNEFKAKTDVDEDYVERVNSLVNSRLNISKMIVENNYYYYITNR